MAARVEPAMHEPSTATSYFSCFIELSPLKRQAPQNDAARRPRVNKKCRCSKRGVREPPQSGTKFLKILGRGRFGEAERVGRHLVNVEVGVLLGNFPPPKEHYPMAKAHVARTEAPSFPGIDAGLIDGDRPPRLRRPEQAMNLP